VLITGNQRIKERVQSDEEEGKKWCPEAEDETGMRVIQQLWLEGIIVTR